MLSLLIGKHYSVYPEDMPIDSEAYHSSNTGKLVKLYLQQSSLSFAQQFELFYSATLINTPLILLLVQSTAQRHLSWRKRINVNNVVLIIANL